MRELVPPRGRRADTAIFASLTAHTSRIVDLNSDGSVAALVTMVAFAARVVPAMRAVRIDPTRALRED